MEPLKGFTTPRYLSVPESGCSQDFADRAIELALFAGLDLDDAQQLSLRCMLTEDAEGQWAAFEAALLEPRQNGKSYTLEAFDLAKLYLPKTPRLILHTAHLFPTAMESFRHLLGCIRNTPELWAEVTKVNNSHGSEGIELKSGARLRFAARGVNGAGRGFSPDDVVFDEAYRLPHEALSALMPALSARPNPQIVYASSTGFPDSEVLWSLVERGRPGGDESLCYMEWCADADADLDDREQWAKANPALGRRLTVRKIAAERASMRDEDFARERLGLWAESKRQNVFPGGMWDLCADPDSQIADMPMFAAVVSTDRSTASIGVCGARNDGLEHLELAVNGRGTDWIVPKLAEITARNGGSVVIDPGAPEGSLIDDLRAAGVRVHTVTAREYAQACGWMFDAVQNKELRHLGDGVLDESVSTASLRTLAGGFAWDLREPRADGTPLKAVTLACWGHRTYGGNIAEAVW